MGAGFNQTALFHDKDLVSMSKCPYNASADPCEFEVQLMVANVAEEEATETFHEIDAEINKLLRRIHLLEALLQRNGIPAPELDD